MPIIELQGCTPEPLMNYLKALGVLRIIVEQELDPTARGFWKNHVFCLLTQLSEDQIVEFFATRYQPSPILSPWNGEAGFLADTGAGYEAISKMQSSTSDRLLPMRDAILGVKSIDLFSSLTSLRAREKALKKKKNKQKKLAGAEADELKATTSSIKRLKENVIFQLRGQFPEASLAWLDSCMVVGTDGFKSAPHLGSGGVDGRMEFSVNYINNVMLALEDKRTAAWARDSIAATNRERNISSSIGQFAPGRIGGANGTQGMEGSSTINPWDFVLMIEGSVFLAGSTNRKLGTSDGSKAVFPFTMNSAPVGMETLTDSDGIKSKGELWLPLWERPASIGELQQLFSEGRADLNGRQARDGVDFSRAVANLGVDRGIKSFSRQAFLQRNGLSFIATPLGQFEVAAKNDASLLREIDPWLSRFRQACGDKSPARFRTALREIERSIFDYCQYGDSGNDKARFQRILVALGNAESLVARAPRFRTDAKGLRPLASLSQQWVSATDDESPEFIIALALASISNGGIGSIRLNLEDVEPKGRQYVWSDKSHASVWSGAGLVTNLAAVLYRRVMEADRAGNPAAALTSSHRATLTDIGEFLAGHLDEERISALLWGLSLCRTWEYRRKPNPSAVSPQGNALVLPSAYCLLKLLFHTPAARQAANEGEPMHPNLGLLGLLRADRTGDACQRAARLLRGKSLTPRPSPMHGFPSRDDEWLESACSVVDSQTLAASLLIPISDYGLDSLKLRVLREKPEPNH
ncbi:MAG: type I-U CRISPR-associated protein Csx17 [Verrucomicrobia bacterium]|nr:type I-U CRISPR-associated protein Csx17 [Verrucomicrobiota bacterium]